MALPKRTIDELRTRYQLEPHLDDVFLEGNSDKKVIDLSMKYQPDHYRPTYLIQDIEINGQILAKLGLSSGNRQRVIALSMELDLPLDTNVSFLIDKYFDHWISENHSFSGLTRTKYCDLEAIFIDEELVINIVENYGNVELGSHIEYITGLEFCLKQLYSIRLEAKINSVNCSIADFRKCLEWDGDQPKLHLEKLIERSFSSSLSKEEIKAITPLIEDRIDTLSEVSIKLATRGHDFIRFLSWSIKSKGGSSNHYKEETLNNIIFMFTSRFSDEIIYPLKTVSHPTELDLEF